jgi:UDP-N-acetylglucosamine--N-acetylmuramyl-(pentapeptide) pyrophosphoryl-undecaprenol N-acetylglucosamine transferase
MDRPGSEIFIFAGGGTGGHLYPGLAVAEELLAIRPEARIVFACSHRAIDRRILDPLPHGVVPQPVKPLPRGLRGWWSFFRAWRASGALARDMVQDLRPAAVLGLGGFAAGPVVKEAARRGIRTALLNPDAVPGKANRYLARRVQAIFTQFPSTRECFPPGVRPKVHPVGCPIRAGFGKADREEAIRHFGLRADRKTLVIVGGSLGAASINGAIAALRGELDQLADQWQALHVTGPGTGDSGGGATGMSVRYLEYCDRMDLAYAAADLALGRAGAVTVAELAAMLTPAVLMPYPHHKDRQQQLNAAGLAQAGAAVICEDAKDPHANAARLAEVLIPMMRDAARLEAMRDAARAFARPGAARDVATWLGQERAQRNSV